MDNLKEILKHPAEKFLDRAAKLNGKIVSGREIPESTYRLLIAFGNTYKTEEGNIFAIVQDKVHE